MRTITAITRAVPMAINARAHVGISGAGAGVGAGGGAASVMKLKVALQSLGAGGQPLM